MHAWHCENPTVERAYLRDQNAMLRLVARVLIARQHGLCRAGVEAITIRTRIRKGRLSPRSALAGENVIVLTQNSSVRNKRRTHLVLVVARISVAQANFLSKP
jgi:hypothetical protein